MNKIVQLFNKDTMLNDVKVSQFVQKHFRVIFKPSTVKFDQASKKMIWK